MTDKKFSKAQLSKIIQSGGLLGEMLGNMMGNLGKKALLDPAAPLDKDVSPKFPNKETLAVLDKLEKRNRWERCCKSRQRIHFIHMDDIINIVESLEKSDLLTDGATKQ